MDQNKLTKEVIEQYFKLSAAFFTLENGQDQDALEQVVFLFHEQADFNIPGDTRTVPWIGKKQGGHEVKRFFIELKELAKSQDFRVDSVLVDNSQAVALGGLQTLVKATGKLIETEFAFVFKVEEGKIVYFRLYEDSFAVAEAMK